MTDRLLFELPLSPPAVFTPSPPLPPLIDESLFLQASARWRETSQGLRELVTSSPRLRDTLNQLLQRELNLDGQLAGLLFPATDEQPERFVSLTDACAFVVQHPTLEETLDQQCRVTGVDQPHPLSALTPLQMLARLKKLNLEQALGERWRTFWASRAPGTPVSRQQRSIQLYRDHFEAAAQLAFAQKTLTAQQLKPLLTLIDTPPAEAVSSDPPIRTETLALVLSNQSRVKLTGAWVITTGDPASASPLLYLPSRPFAIQVFKQRSDMQDWLSRQALVPRGLPSDNMHFEYTVQTKPFVVGSSDLYAAHLEAQVTALRHGTRGKPGLAEHGGQALSQAEQIDRQHSKIAVFASPPKLETGDDDTQVDEPALFGSLYADIPRSMRKAALDKQREALETLVEAVGEGEGLQPFKDSLKALENAEQAADKACTALLHRSRALDLDRFQQEFSALHTAHKAGLHAEAALQLALKQLTDEECSRLKAVLDTPDEPGLDAVAASLTLSTSEQQDDGGSPTTQVLNGAFVVTGADALIDADSPHSVLLYWPGAGGGLQRFANRRELEHQVFMLHDQDSKLTVQLKKISGDALLHGLDQLTSDFEKQAGKIRQLHAEPADAAQRAEQLEILRQGALARLQVPVHAARSLAFTHLLEQDRSGALAANLPQWLNQLPEADRNELKGLIQAYIPAMQRSHELMTIALEPRDDFTRKHLHARLRKDFAVKGSFDVKLDLPDSVRLENQFVEAPGAPGTPQKLKSVPSISRSKMSLEDLAQHNIDTTPSMNLVQLALRLSYMQVQVTADDETESKNLTTGITVPWLKRVLPELDLAQAYEKQIRKTFMGAADESVFVKEHRRECLIEPWRLMLKLQGECSRLQKQISVDELKVLNIAIDANSAEAWNADGKRIVMLAAFLSAGGKDTPGEGSATLSGVTFIEEQVSGTTLLYLPDSPDGQFLRRYDNLEGARKALFNLCLHQRWVSYLAGRALQGQVAAHERRINQAVLTHFDAMIGVGARWPATTSLAAHLLDGHMGRLIEAHRGTSRSNYALYMERYALKGPRAFNYMKMAMGMVPFVGVTIALYDAWTAANQATAAFIRGEVGDGLSEVESVLLSLIDAAMDLLPGEVASSALSRTARSFTRTRQLNKLVRNVAAMQHLSLRQARHVLARFAGYEYEKPLSLLGLQPATHGLYRGIYRHADGDFIERQGRIFQVELSKDSRNWRLFGNSRKTYKQPVALDETGHWDTWFGVYGTAFEGGGLGGGQVYGHLADALDPIWPQAVRQRLPRWWTDQRFRRLQQLNETAQEVTDEFRVQTDSSAIAINNYQATTMESRPALRPTVDALCDLDIELAIRRHRVLVELEPLTQGRKKRELIEAISKGTWILADRYRHRASYASDGNVDLFKRMTALKEELDKLPSTALEQRAAVNDGLRKLQVEFVANVEQMQKFKAEANYWFDRISIKSHKALLKSIMEEMNQNATEARLTFLKTIYQMKIVRRDGTTDDAAWQYLKDQVVALRDNVARALSLQNGLPEVIVTREQRNQSLQVCVSQYTEFRRKMRVWTTSYPEYFHMDVVDPLLAGIDKMTVLARKGIDQSVPVAPKGEISKKLFPTEDNQWLIGVESWDPKSKKRLFKVNDNEVWEQTSGDKFRLLPPSTPGPAAVQPNLAALLDEAQKRLDYQPKYQAKVEGYAEQDMLPVDLEHMLVSEADELIRRADRIEGVAAQEQIIRALRDKADELKTTGRSLRTRQSLTTRKPTDGMLLDLIEQDAVEIRKKLPIRNLGKRRDGHPDYMQEYEIWDMTLTEPELLWYAHFHYKSDNPPQFKRFEKAHLKLPEHRYLTHADDANLPYADIGNRSAVLQYFETL